jgi:hypothetical protein
VRAEGEGVLPNIFGSTDVPGLGRCSADTERPIWNGQEVLKISCESPEALRARVRLVDPVTGRDWKVGLGEAASYQFMPSLVWLSPLNRRQAFLQIVDRETQLLGDRWLVPRPVFNRARIHIQPLTQLGCSTIRYGFDIANIRQWEVRESR